MSVLVVGGGLFGLTAAIELRRRGHQVTLLERSVLPNEEAASEDISKMVRLDYGDHAGYTSMMEVCEPALQAWNKKFGERVFSRTGILNVSEHASQPPGTFSGDSLAMLQRRGHPFERLTKEELASRFPAWKGSTRQCAYLNPAGGWMASGKLVSALGREAVSLGVDIIVDQAESIVYDDDSSGAAVGVRAASGKVYVADKVVVAAGAWTPTLVPQTRHILHATAQPVVHFDVSPWLELFQGDVFPAWSSDTEFTGFYGFPAKRDGRLKIGHHSDGYAMRTPTSRAISQLRARVKDKEVKKFREFVARSFPRIPASELPVSGFRICLYCDSFDGDFLIGEDPKHANLFVSSGGSGHGAKFTPLLGQLLADAVEGKRNDFGADFAWRDRPNGTHTDKIRHKSKL